MHVAVLSSCSAGAIACEAFPTDVPQGSSTYDMVEMFVQRGYIDLYEDNTFRGGGDCKPLQSRNGSVENA